MPFLPGVQSVNNLQFAQKAVVTLDDSKILLVRKSADDPYRPGKWDLPGGRLKAGEELDSHLTREVMEETGLRVTPGKLIDLWDWYLSSNGEYVRVLAVSRYCRLESDEVSQTSREPDDYIAEQRWFSLDEIRDLDIIPSQVRTIDLVLKDLAECQPVRRS
jgi:8-oxo-dGTP pyrophosphatase MutT (NUDIX family)